jgi:murein L,D-transpeptidase YcbB/YkuD
MRRRTLCRTLAAWPLASASGLTAAADGSGWLEGGRPGRLAAEALELLASADSHGLDPQDYAVELLRRELQSPSWPAATLDGLLGAAMERYLGDLSQGRVDPRRLHADFAPVRRDGFDAAAALAAALQRRRLADAVREATPRVPPYEPLRDALRRYRGLGAHAAWAESLPALPSGPRGRGPRLEAGQAWPGLDLLARRLEALGDLMAGTPRLERYEGALVDAVRGFQRRHGLDDDGVVGAGTLAQLQVSPARRVRQIELTLERLRWTPLEQGPRQITINVPEFVLRAYEVRDGRLEVRATMKVIVGRAMKTQTPLFDEDMRFIEFSPYWNVPPSIARGEVVPRLRRDPGYWTREGFEFVGAGGSVVTALSPADLDAVLAGRMRIRQRPGPRNALGDIKFVFPNHDNIYLHHTPATQLFERGRRDFSHGCIRVEQPVALALFALQRQPGWDEARIRQAMEAGKSVTLRLDEPVPVLIAYATALVKEGRLHFFDDLYGHDRVLDAALKQPRPALRPRA